ncbi:MAG: tyrosine-type recombinase/integrase, partial [Thermoanaerobaculia bacterium]
MPKELPEKPLRIDTGIWLLTGGKFAAYIYSRGKDMFVGDFDTVQEALAARHAKQDELLSGRPIVQRRATRVTLATFSETIYFPETLGLLKDSTRRTSLSRYMQHVKPVLGDISLRDITYDACSAFRSSMMKKSLSGQTRRESVRILRAVLADAAKRSLIPVNPAVGLQLPPKDGRAISVPSFENAVKVVEAIVHPVARMAGRTLLGTGMRLNECLALRWENVDLEAGTIYVCESIDQVAGKIVTPKTAAGIRTVEAPADLIAALTTYREGQKNGTVQRNDPWVFPAETDRTEGRPPVLNDRNFVQRSWEPAVRSVGCPRFTPHALRHVYCSILLMRHAPVAWVAQQVGHASPAFTYRQYTRFLRSMAESGRGYL